MIPYGRQWIGEEDIDAVVKTLRSAWLTTGPHTERFEAALANFVGAKHGIAVSSGTAALHAALAALEIGPGDEVIVPPMTFAATANSVVFQGAKPVFADVEPDTLLLDPAKVEEKITPRTKAVIAVDYAGQPCDYGRLRAITDRYHLALVADACHALGASYHDRPVGTLADLSVFSFHPVKAITTGEGGMIVTDDSVLAQRMRRFRNHGISTDHHRRTAADTWEYDILHLGYNYRISDIQCALGLSQLPKLPQWIKRRREIAAAYNRTFLDCADLEPLTCRESVRHAYHLYVLRTPAKWRRALFKALRAKNIGVNVHYIPVHLHPFYRQRFRTTAGMCPVAEENYERILSLPIFPAMTDHQTDTVITALLEAISTFST